MTQGLRTFICQSLDLIARDTQSYILKVISMKRGYSNPFCPERNRILKILHFTLLHLFWYFQKAFTGHSSPFCPQRDGIQKWKFKFTQLINKAKLIQGEPFILELASPFSSSGFIWSFAGQNISPYILWFIDAVVEKRPPHTFRDL